MTTHEELKAAYFEFGKKHVAAHVQQHEQRHTFNREAFRLAGEMGLYQIMVPKALGGQGLDFEHFASALLGFAQGSEDLGLAVSVVAHAGCAIPALIEFGSKEALARLLPSLLTGEHLAAIANNERDTGTNVLGLKSQACAAGEKSFRLRVRKYSITNVPQADLVLVSAKQNEKIDVFAVESKQLKQRAISDLSGLRTSCTGHLAARNVLVPSWRLLGAGGQGVAIFRSFFAHERLLIGYLFLSVINRCVERAIQIAETKVVAGEALGTNQYVQEKIVNIRIAKELLSAQLESAIKQLGQANANSAALSVIKLWGAEVAINSCELLTSMLGSRGLRAESGVQKDLRDLKALSILGGTAELQKMVIYKETVKEFQGKQISAAPANQGITFEHVTTQGINKALESSLIALTSRAFPGEETLAKKYYYDSVPTELVLARLNGNLIGFRALTRRTVQVGARRVNLVGMGIAVDPAHQRRGIGKKLTEESLKHVSIDEIALAFLMNRNAEALLASFGFVSLKTKITFESRVDGSQVTESMPCFARETGDHGIIELIESTGHLHLGLGTW
jgi:alkylation response protein AidB-like acyl-CoA dehydrogenase/N-acetylglutamate synthase-like GNAT family acetyltransferase